MSREVPEGWRATQLGDVVKFEYGKALAAGSRAAGQIPVLGSSGFVGFHNEAAVEGPSIVISRKGSLGGVFFIEGDFWPIDTTYYLVRKEQCDWQWLTYLLKFSALERLNEATGVPGLNRDKAARESVLIPPLHEQHRIAEILSSVDDAIAATRAVIEQTKKIKQGVLERLLTKGIGHTRFKQTEIGEIPEGWEMATLEELLADIPTPMRSGPFGSALKSEELVDAGVPFLGIDNIHVERFIPTFKRFLSKEKFGELERFSVNPEDVVITIMGTVGRSCVIPADIGDAVSSKHIWAMSFDKARYIPELACWQLNFAPWIVRKFSTSAQGGIMSAINSGILRKLVFPVPSFSEQQQIFDVWRSFQKDIQIDEAMLQNMLTLKSALMSDLLTGRKRVTRASPLTPQEDAA
jgi:type I restriction enzyme, S subunit